MPDNPSVVGAVSAMIRAIGAGSACAGRQHATRNAFVRLEVLADGTEIICQAGTVLQVGE